MLPKGLRHLISLGIVCVLAQDVGAWTLTRDFNKGRAGEKVTAVDGLDSAQGRTMYSNDIVYEGAGSAKLTILKGQEGWGTWGGLINHPTRLGTGDEFWLRVRTYYPAGFDYFSYGGGNRLKFLRVHTQNGKTGAHEGYNDILIDQKSSKNAFMFGFEGENRWRGIGAKSALPAFDRWETYELYIKFHPVSKSAGGEALIRFWKNGELLADITDRKTLVGASSVVTRSLLFTYWNGGAPKTQSMWVDDIILTSETPATKDAHGNPFIGVGALQTVSPPTAPSLTITK